MVKNMRVERKESIHPKVPFYRQDYDFSCGPASLMMAIKFFDDNLDLAKNLEIDMEGREHCGSLRDEQIQSRMFRSRTRLMREGY